MLILQKNNGELRGKGSDYYEESGRRLTVEWDVIYEDAGKEKELRGMYEEVLKKIHSYFDKLENAIDETREKMKSYKIIRLNNKCKSLVINKV